MGFNRMEYGIWQDSIDSLGSWLEFLLYMSIFPL
jgi:hypothetical protein